MLPHNPLALGPVATLGCARKPTPVKGPSGLFGAAYPIRGIMGYAATVILPCTRGGVPAARPEPRSRSRFSRSRPIDAQPPSRAERAAHTPGTPENDRCASQRL